MSGSAVSVGLNILTSFVLCFQSRRPSAIPDLLDGYGLVQQCGKRDGVPQQLPTPLEHAPIDNEWGYNRHHDTAKYVREYPQEPTDFMKPR